MSPKTSFHLNLLASMQLHRYVRFIHNKNHIEVKIKKYQQKNGRGGRKRKREKKKHYSGIESTSTRRQIIYILNHKIILPNGERKGG